MKILIANEILKLRTVRGPWLLLIASQALVVAGVGGLIASRTNVHLATTPRSALAHVGLASLFTLLLGIGAVASEYRHRTIADTYLGTPRRSRVILAKLCVYTLAGAGFGVIDTATGLIVTALWLAARGAALNLGSADLWRTIAGGIAWNAAFAAIGVGLGALICNLAAAIGIALTWLALVEGIVGQILVGLSRWLPFRSGLALDHTPGSGAGLPQWGAALVLAGYAAGFAILALSTTIRRDVT